LEVRDLKKHFPLRHGWWKRGAIRAVDGVSFSLQPGQTLGLVGESGCGKTTTGRMIARLETLTGGEIHLNGQDITRLGGAPLRESRRHIQMVFQDPYASVDPKMTVVETVAEPLAIRGLGTRAERRERAHQLLGLVGLDPTFGSRLPHQMSGGQLQRVGIARALALSPSVVVCDEPTSALDVSVRAQVVNLLKEIQERLGISYVFISHDMATVRHVSHQVAVMYLGRIVELAPAEQLFKDPQHPYTRALVSAVPIPNPRLEAQRPVQVLEGEVPSPADPPSGCHFHPAARWRRTSAKCRNPNFA